MKFDNYLIRQISSDDVQAYFNLIDNNRERLEHFFAGTVSRNKSIEDTRSFIASILERAEKNSYFPFVIIDTASQSLIGYTDVKSIDWTIPKAELGFFIDEKYQGKGIITKAVGKITEHCFDQLKIKKLFLRTHKDNTGSKTVAEKNGFEVEGIIRSDYKTTNGTIVDLIYYGRLNKNI
jgi:ribosomal-protein-serine acetyltransferase